MKATIKLYFIGAIVLALILSYGYFFLCAGGESQHTPEVVVDTWTKPLTESGYKPTTGDKPEGIPGDKIPPEAEPVMYAEGTYNDSLSVEVSVLETPDNELWVKATVNGEEVKIRTFEWIREPAPTHDNDWSLLVAGEWVDGVDAGIGVVWEPLAFRGARIGLQAVCDINRDLGDAPDWGSVAARMSRRVGAFSVGGYAGYRLGEGPGFATGISAGITVGL